MDKRTKDLITKYFDQQLSDQEARELIEWVDNGNLRIFNEYVMINFTVDEIEAIRQGPDVESWSKILAKIDRPKGKMVKIGLWRYAAAAAVILLVWLPFLLKRSDLNFDNDGTVSRQSIVPGTDKAVLTLENGEHITLEKGNVYDLANRTSDGEKLVYDISERALAKAQYNYLTIPKGGQFFVQLSDGTKVWLNSDSKLKYPINFIEGEMREVELLYGEAYFDVSSSEDHNGATFKVKSQAQNIVVLGTEFNVKAYREDEASYTTLVEGSIAISNDVVSNILRPSEQSVINAQSEQIEIRTVDIAYETAWKNGFFMFRKEPLFSMLKTLSRWYDLEIVYEDEKKKDEIFSGMLKRTDDVLDLLVILEKTGEVTFSIENKRIIVK